VRRRLAGLAACGVVLAAACVTLHPDRTAYGLGEPSGATAFAPAPEPGKALVVFLRPMYTHWKPWAFGMENVQYFPPSVYRVDGDTRELIGFVDEGNKVAAQCPTGPQLFMIDSTENMDFLEATLDAGKTYYVMVEPRTGVAVPRWSLVPVRAAAARSPFFARTLREDTVWMQLAQPGREWYDNNRARLTERQGYYRAKWDSREDKARRKKLEPGDGV
jgi:hypothetical protein